MEKKLKIIRSSNLNIIRMKVNEIKTTICLVIMIVFGMMAFLTKDVLNSQLFASLGIIAGALLSKLMSTQNINIDEK